MAEALGWIRTLFVRRRAKRRRRCKRARRAIVSRRSPPGGIAFHAALDARKVEPPLSHSQPTLTKWKALRQLRAACSAARPSMEVVVFSSGITTLVHVARQTVDIADQHASETTEKQRQTLGQRSQLDEVLSSSSVLDLRSSNVGDTTAPIRTTEAGLEYLIAVSARLAHGDVQKDLDNLKDRLDGLKRTKESLLARMAGADPAVLKGIAEQLAAVDVEIKEILIQIQAIETAERDEKDASTGRADDSTRIEAQLEKTARAYEDLLQLIWP